MLGVRVTTLIAAVVLLVASVFRCTSLGAKKLTSLVDLSQRVAGPRGLHMMGTWTIHELEEKYGNAEAPPSGIMVMLNHLLVGESQSISPSHNVTRDETPEPSTTDAPADDAKKLRGETKFKVDDVVEIMTNRVLMPFKVTHVRTLSDHPRAIYYDDDADLASDHVDIMGYDLARASDGLAVSDIPESSLRHYAPYPIGADALCNVGDLEHRRDDLEPCSVVDYIPSEKRGTSMLQNRYSVRIFDKRKGHYDASLPIWKLQRVNDII